MIKELNLDKESFVIEIASNDGYLLKNFIEKKIPCLRHRTNQKHS